MCAPAVLVSRCSGLFLAADKRVLSARCSGLHLAADKSLLTAIELCLFLTDSLQVTEVCKCRIEASSSLLRTARVQGLL